MICEIPLRARNTTKKIQTKRPKLGKGVTRQVRLSKQAKTGEAPGPRKLMPLRFTHGPKFQISDDSFEQAAQNRQVGKSRRRAPMSFNDPLDSVHARLRLGLAAIRTKLADLRDRLAAIQTELRFRCRGHRPTRS